MESQPSRRNLRVFQIKMERRHEMGGIRAAGAQVAQVKLSYIRLLLRECVAGDEKRKPDAVLEMALEMFGDRKSVV